MRDIFVSYRRSDTSAIVGRVIDRLEAKFGKQHVFRDIDSIDYGQDFGEVIHQAIAGCSSVLVIIGDEWLSLANAAAERRLNNPEDWVHLEISMALKQGKQIIPVLVEGAEMPSPNQLPGPLKSLAKLNAAVVRDDPDFNGDMERLCQAIKLRSTASAFNLGQLLKRRRLAVVLALTLMGVLIPVAYSLLNSTITPSPGPKDPPIAFSTIRGGPWSVELDELDQYMRSLPQGTLVTAVGFAQNGAWVVGTSDGSLERGGPIPAEMDQYITQRPRGTIVTAVGIAQNGAWVVGTSDGGLRRGGSTPVDMDQYIMGLPPGAVTTVGFAQNGAWVVGTRDGGLQYGGPTSVEMKQHIERLPKSLRVEAVGFTEHGGWIVAAYQKN